MDAEKVSFQDIYEMSLSRIFRDANVINAGLLNELKEKREFGLKKYGEYSFQSTFEKSMTSPVKEHLLEELIDACNYTAHIVYQNKLVGNKDEEEKFLSILTRLYDLFNTVC